MKCWALVIVILLIPHASSGEIIVGENLESGTHNETFLVTGRMTFDIFQVGVDQEAFLFLHLFVETSNRASFTLKTVESVHSGTIQYEMENILVEDKLQTNESFTSYLVVLPSENRVNDLVNFRIEVIPSTQEELNLTATIEYNEIKIGPPSGSEYSYPLGFVGKLQLTKRSSLFTDLYAVSVQIPFPWIEEDSQVEIEISLRVESTITQTIDFIVGTSGTELRTEKGVEYYNIPVNSTLQKIVDFQIQSAIPATIQLISLEVRELRWSYQLPFEISYNSTVIGTLVILVSWSLYFKINNRRLVVK